VDEQSNATEPALKATAQLVHHGRAEIGKVIAGQEELIDQALITVLSRGHALIEGVPGIAKTMLVKLMGRLLGLDFHRVQATPDLMPADILGTVIFRPQTQEFALHRGPVFTDFLLVDEINGRSPSTASDTRCPMASLCSLRRTRSIRKAHIHCRKPSSIAF
jgi:MoxR-like ATPase